jgi:hypothetical protein
MKSAEVQIGKNYQVNLKGKTFRMRITGVLPRPGHVFKDRAEGWIGFDIETGGSLSIKSSRPIIREIASE